MGSNIDANILEFSQQRPLWQRDLFRRVFTQQSCSVDDLNQVLLLLKGEKGLHPEGSPEALSADHIRYSEAGGAVTILSSISETRNVNRLTTGQELPFASQGITLIYGDNGSGKSGYSRILRQLCRTRRERPEKVLGDVYASSAPPPAQAKLTYSVGGESREYLWTEGAPSPKELSRLTLFDANAAPIYVDKQNQIEFLPEGLDVLPRVGAALLSIGETLDAEISPLSSALQHPVISVSANTSAAKLVSRLVSTAGGDLPSTEDIQSAGSWSSEDEDALAGIRESLATMSEPTKAAAKCRRLKGALDRVASRILDGTNLLNEESLLEFARLHASAKSTRETAAVSATEKFRDDPFGASVGNEAWRVLFRYAREFSEVVYPGETFPVLGTDKRCVLCQQPLSDSASQRLSRFHSFVTESSSRDAEQLERSVAAKLQTIQQLKIPTSTELQPELAEYAASGIDAEALVNAATAFVEALRRRQSWAIQMIGSGIQDQLPILPISPIDSLKGAANALEIKAIEYGQVLQDGVLRANCEQQKNELESRKLLNTELARVLERRELLDMLKKMRECRAVCDTTTISRKASKLRDEYINQGFEARLSKEVAGLGIGYLPLKVASKSEHGTSYLGIALDQTAGARTAAVLSEGEFRVLALACFLAEVGGIEGHNGIIVDDPVSSLDHRHIRQVARRLVSEASVRPQVVIFTHSLAFYYELLEAAQEGSVQVETHWIQRLGAKSCGKVEANDAPWQVKKVKDRITTLEKKLSSIPQSANCTEVEYLQHVKAFYGLLRETWERLVEERLLNGVVGRFEPSVKTQSLKGVIVEDDDYQQVFSAMKKASRYSGHDGAVAFQTSLPDTPEMQADLDHLRKYEQELKKRSAKVENLRKELETPVKVKTA